MLQSSGVSPTRGAKRPGPRGIPVPVPGAWLFSALQLWIGQSDRCAHRITRQKGLLKLTPPLRHRTDPEGISFKRAIEASAKIDDHGQGHTHGDQAVQRLRVRARLPEAAAARREDGPHEMAVPGRRRPADVALPRRRRGREGVAPELCGQVLSRPASCMSPASPRHTQALLALQPS